MNIKEIKKVLKEAGRYEDTLRILGEIINTNKVPDDAPISSYYLNSDGELTCRVDGKLVRKEASALLNILIHEEDLDINVSHLDEYITSATNIMLHNYALYISHGMIPNHTIDEINQWQVLNNLVIFLASFSFDDTWHIPDGWKRKTEDKVKADPESNSFRFIEEDSYTCPRCGVIIDRESLPNPPEFNNAIKERHSIKCPSCGNYGMNYMSRGYRMQGYTLADLVTVYNIDRI